MKNHPLIETLRTLKGNPRACVYSEPLWYIPFTLYTPFISVYMAALLLTDSQIGIVASVTTLFMAVFALLSGAITDKMGRRKATFVFDILSWSIPCLLWAVSRNFWWFMVAAAFNGMMQVTGNSWTCLLVEDADKRSIVKIFSLLHVIGQMAVVFAPLAAVLVRWYTIVPVMRGLYTFAFLSMTAKFILLYKFSDETKVGKIRKKETENQSILKIMSGYGGILRRILASAEMKLALTIQAVFNITSMVASNFFGLYTTGPLMVPEYYLAYYPIVRSLIIVVFMFLIQPRLSKSGVKGSMITGVVLYITGHIVLLLSPVGNLVVPFAYIFVEACAYSLVMPNRDALVNLLIDPDERARIYSIMTFLVLCCTMPFGYLAGRLSDISRQLPFMLNIAFFVLVFAVIAASGKLIERKADKEHK